MSNLLSSYPTRTIDRIQSMFDDLFEAPASFPAAWIPPVDIKETEKEYTFHCELPGVEKENVDVELHGDVMTIRGHREESKQEKKEGYIRRERQSGRFERSFRLQGEVWAGEVKAEFKNGVLNVTVPKHGDADKKRIPVS